MTEQISVNAGLVPKKLLADAGYCSQPKTPPRPTSCARRLTTPGDSTLPFRHATLGPDLTSAARRAARTHAISELLGLPLCRGHRGRVRPRLHRGHALRRPAALSSDGLVRTCAAAAPMAIGQQRGRLGFCPICGVATRIATRITNNRDAQGMAQQREQLGLAPRGWQRV